MTEKQNTSNISILQTATPDTTGIKSIPNGVINKSHAKNLLVRGTEDPKAVTKAIHSILESITKSTIHEQTSNDYRFLRWTSSLSINEAHQHKEKIQRACEECMAVADPSQIQQWIIEVMVCTAKQSALTETDMALKAKVYAQKLAHVPADILKNACNKICMNSKFFPSLAEIYSFVEPQLHYRKSLVELMVNKLIVALAK